MIAESTPPGLSPRARAVADQIDHAVLWVATHWLAVIVGYGTVVVGLAITAPFLEARGHETAARFIYTPFRLICHQREDRSFHLHGEQLAFCQRDVAIVGGAVGVALLYGIIRQWRAIPAASLASAILLAIPMAIDGGTQLVGLRESTALVRVVTGALFSLGAGWFVLPHLQAGFTSVGEGIVERQTNENVRTADSR